MIIAYLRGLEQAVDFVNNLLRDGAMMGCCPVNVAEIYAGMREKERNITEKLINSLRFFSANLETAKLAGDMIRDLRNKGITLALADAIIAAVVIQNDLILVTYNKRHYTMPGIALISPDESSR